MGFVLESDRLTVGGNEHLVNADDVSSSYSMNADLIFLSFCIAMEKNKKKKEKMLLKRQLRKDRKKMVEIILGKLFETSGMKSLRM